MSTYWKNVKDFIKFICYKIMPHVYDVIYIFLVSTLSRVSFLLLYIIGILNIVAILSLVLVREAK